MCKNGTYARETIEITAVAYKMADFARDKLTEKRRTMTRMTFRESEQRCEQTFMAAGRWWHLYTSGKETPLIFKNDDDYRFVINLLARCAIEYPSIHIVAFEVMSNHIHIACCGEYSAILEFFKLFRRRLARYFSKSKRILPESFKANIKTIEDMSSLRNTIVYINRNGYVVNPSFTPFSYPWGTGKFYFTDFLIEDKIGNYSTRELRIMLQCDVPDLPSECKIINSHIAPPSFCAIKLGMALFRDAHHYFSLVSKNVESYSQLATDLDDGEFLTDQELFSEMVKILNDNYAGAKLRTLSSAQKLDLAKTLHFKYHSSNGQIRRLLNLTQYEVDQMFPKR